MSNDDSYDQETVAAILNQHGVDSVDELPQPVRLMFEAVPDADCDPFARLRR
jgi:hypothetical protein